MEQKRWNFYDAHQRTVKIYIYIYQFLFQLIDLECMGQDRLVKIFSQDFCIYLKYGSKHETYFYICAFYT